MTGVFPYMAFTPATGGALVTPSNPFPVTIAGAGYRDAFGRLRTSEPQTLYDAKQIGDNLPLFWDDQETSGSGTGSSHSTNTATTTLSVSNTTAGTRTRQTFQRFNYSPGKSVLIMLTGTLDLSGGGTGIISRMGYFDGDNGFFLANDEGTIKFVKRSKITGTPVDTEVAQSSWNSDTMDGTGDSGETLDISNAQIVWIDIEYLGVGSVRCGFVIDGAFILAHTFHHANTITGAYMSTPNLPIRYEITNDGTGEASTMSAICATVISEGGAERLGTLRSVSTGGTHVDANTADTIYAILGIRLKSGYLGASIFIEQLSMIAETGTDFEWMLLLNPTVAGTFTYGDETNSAVQTATGATANTVTNGTSMDGGFVKSSVSSGQIERSVQNALRLGAAIDGTVDEIVLCARPLAANADIQASMTWREVL